MNIRSRLLLSVTDILCAFDRFHPFCNITGCFTERFHIISFDFNGDPASPECAHIHVGLLYLDLTVEFLCLFYDLFFYLFIRLLFFFFQHDIHAGCVLTCLASR